MKQNNVDPAIWGPGGWHMLHRMSFRFDSASSAHDFYMTFKRLLPCEKCRQNFAKHVANLTFPKRKEEIPMWMLRLHNLVNVAKEKEIYQMSGTELKKRYANVDESEWLFVSSVIDSHPGKRGITPEYVSDLHTFLCQWTNSISITCPTRNVIVSKTQLRKWLQQHHAFPKKVRRCTSDVCEI